MPKLPEAIYALISRSPRTPGQETIDAVIGKFIGTALPAPSAAREAYLKSDWRPHPADVALDALAQGWRRDAWRSASVRELAIEFRRRMQEHPELVGKRLVSKSIEGNYPAFCRSLGLGWWPPFTEFAAELKKVMPWKRCEVRRGGKPVGTVSARTSCRIRQPRPPTARRPRWPPWPRWPARGPQWPPADWPRVRPPTSCAWAASR